MNISVRYQSRGGNTRAVAEVIAQTLGVNAEPLAYSLSEYTDVLFLGGGVYKWDADPELKAFLEKMQPSQIGQIVAFSTAGGMKITLKRIVEAAKKAGIPVYPNQLYMPLLLQGDTGIGREGGHLTPEQEQTVSAFTLKVASDLNLLS